MFADVKRAVLAAVVAALALPASAFADTTIVDPSSGGSCARGGACKSIGDAAAVSQANDVLTVRRGSYIEDVTVGAALTGLTINASPGSALQGTLTLNAPDVEVDGLTIFAATGSAAITAAGKVTLTDVTALSSAGSALTLASGTGSRIQRSTLATAAPAGDGIKQGPAGLVVDSSVVIGGAQGAAFRVTTTNGSADATLALNHVTTVSARAILLEGPSANELSTTKVGNIALTVASSIIHGPSAATSDPGIVVAPLPPVRAPNSVTAAFTASDASAFTGADGQTVAGTGGETANDRLFGGSSLRLRFDAPVIDRGDPVMQGESTTDIDGDPRLNGSATDIGADEFTNHAPTLTLSVLPASPRTGEKVTASGKATDPEGASDIKGYATNWGDGSRTDITTHGVVEHVYDKPGTYIVTMISGDQSGALSAAVQQQVTVVDADPPQVRITAPAAGALVRLNSDRGHKRLRIQGVDSDASGVARVEVALTKLGRKNKCKQYAGQAFGRGGCDQFVFLEAVLSGSAFTWRTQKGVVIPKGSYAARVRATDVRGNGTKSFSKAKQTLVKFKVR